MTELADVAQTAVDCTITITSQVIDGRYEMCFADTGKGMDATTLEKLFEPLFSTKSFGTGLGMPTVQQIMELHDGGIDVDSTLGKGTAVTLWLPFKEAGGASAAA